MFTVGKQPFVFCDVHSSPFPIRKYVPDVIGSCPFCPGGPLAWTTAKSPGHLRRLLATIRRRREALESYGPAEVAHAHD